MLTLANGDQLFLSNNVKLLFETHDLAAASPAIISRSVSWFLLITTNIDNWNNS